MAAILYVHYRIYLYIISSIVIRWRLYIICVWTLQRYVVY